MARRSREFYEFNNATKRQVKKEQKNRCAITGKKGYTEVHHLLGCALAGGFFPTVEPAIFKQIENAVALDPEIHKQLHDEQREWPPEFTRLFVIGVYKYLRDIHREKMSEEKQELAVV